MTESTYLDMSGYEKEDWKILSPEDSKKVFSTVPEDKMEAKNFRVIRDPYGKKAFGDGAHFFKRAFLSEIKFDANATVENNTAETPSIQIPKPPTIPKPPQKKEEVVIPTPPVKTSSEETKVPSSTKIVNEDNFYEDVVFDQEVANGRINFLVKHGATQEGNNVVTFGKSYSPIQIYKLNSLEWSKIAEAQKAEWDKENILVCEQEAQTGKVCNIQCLICKEAQKRGITVAEAKAQQKADSDKFIAEMNAPLKKATETIDEFFEAENKEEKPVVTKTESKPIESGKVKLRTGLLISAGMTVNKTKEWLIHKETGNQIYINDLDSLLTSEMEELLEHIKSGFTSKISIDIIANPNEAEAEQTSEAIAETQEEMTDEEAKALGDETRKELVESGEIKLPKPTILGAESQEEADEVMKQLQDAGMAPKEVEEISPEDLEAAAEKHDAIAKESRQAKKAPIEVKISKPEKKEPETKEPEIGEGNCAVGPGINEMKNDFFDKDKILEQIGFVEKQAIIFTKHAELLHALYEINEVMSWDEKDSLKLAEIQDRLNSL